MLRLNPDSQARPSFRKIVEIVPKKEEFLFFSAKLAYNEKYVYYSKHRFSLWGWTVSLGRIIFHVK
ncbi:hypothetical protein HMPREF9413_0533 [Paenibacillus sp. HGF7]|nr:hypothetical protein HMPREF9413_0533 [Paenibacillus sp. HGF7]